MRMPCMLHRHQRLCRLSGDSYTMGTHGTYAVHTSCSCMHVHTIDTNRLRGDDEFAKIQQERALRKGGAPVYGPCTCIVSVTKCSRCVSWANGARLCLQCIRAHTLQCPETHPSLVTDPDGTGVKPGYCDSRYYKILAGGNSQGGVGCN